MKNEGHFQMNYVRYPMAERHKVECNLREAAEASDSCRFELMFHVEHLLTLQNLQTRVMFHVEHWSIRFSTHASPKWEHMSPSLKT